MKKKLSALGMQNIILFLLVIFLVRGNLASLQLDYHEVNQLRAQIFPPRRLHFLDGLARLRGARCLFTNFSLSLHNNIKDAK